MFTVELYARSAVIIEGLSRREAAQRFGVHRNTISKILLYAEPPGYRRRERPASKELQALSVWIDGMLESDMSVHKKQHHTAHRIFERLRDERGYSGGYTIVREYVALVTLRSRGCCQSDECEHVFVWPTLPVSGSAALTPLSESGGAV